MGGRVGGISSKYDCDTAGIKVSGGQKVKSGTILTRQGNQWKSGLNVIGRSSLTAACDGEVYFTRRKNGSNKVITLINIKPSN